MSGAQIRISWLAPDVVKIARQALSARASSWGEHFRGGFDAGPAPAAIEPEDWPAIAEHLARAEHVSEVIRDRGIEAALAQFEGSPHAVELATLATAAAYVDAVELDLVAALLERPIDPYIAYGGYLELLTSLGDEQPERTLAIYERFADAFSATRTQQPMWVERVAVVQSGLAGFYVKCRRFDAADAIYSKRHAQEPTTLIVALGASRTFLAAGALSHAIDWLGHGAERARKLARPDMATRLEAKQASLRARQQ
ncbi:MAG: hypothetical protein Tsb0020_37450 [Haliangiales bacterium]